MIISSSGTYTLTADLAEGIVINADNVRLNLNGHTVRGSDGSGIGIYAPKANNVTVYNGKVTGFETGIFLNSTDPVKHTVSGVDVFDCSYMGIGVGNGSARIHDCDVWNIGGQTRLGFVPSWGVVVWGKNSIISDTNVWNVSGRSETAAFGFNSKDNTGSLLVNCTADGAGAVGWSFGVWNSGGAIRVVNSEVKNWDSGIGTVGPATVSGSTIESVAYLGNSLGASGIIDNGGNQFSPIAGHDSKFTTGTQAMDTLVGGSGANTIFGLGGFDHLAGGAGADTFLFRRGDAIVNIMDFTSGDRIGVSRLSFATADLQVGTDVTGTKATFLYDLDDHVLYYDHDGVGQQAREAVAYMPTFVPQQSDIVAVAAPYVEDTLASLALSWSSLACGDFNGDGNTDLIWRNPASDLGEWLLRDGDRAATIALPSMPGWELLATGDFNGDGTDDLLWRQADGSIGDWLMHNGQRTVTFQLASLKSVALATGDFNGDGNSDVLWQNAAGAVSIWAMDEGKRIATLQLPSLKGWTFAGSGDFNDDGTTDILWQNGAGVVGEWLMRDFGRAATMELPAMKGWNQIATGDFNGDGTDDVLWQHQVSGTLLTWMMDGGKVTDTIYFGEASGTELLGVGDIDGNGKADLLWRHLATSNVHAWLI